MDLEDVQFARANEPKKGEEWVMECEFTVSNGDRYATFKGFATKGGEAMSKKVLTAKQNRDIEDALYYNGVKYVPERTCKDVGEPTDFCCSECGARLYTETTDGYTMIERDDGAIIKLPRYCPNCGAKVVE